MIWIKRVLSLLLFVLLLAAAGIGLYIYLAFPQLDGDLQAKGLRSAVSISRDGADVTHIKAQSPQDAWFSLGYVHAQERGWQLEFNRRVMRGQLSEVFGPATLDTDKLLRTLGIMQAAEKQLQGLPTEAKDALKAYSDGINAFYATSPQALQPEFHILGVKPGGASGITWSPQDSVGWSLMMALDLGGNWGNEFARLSAAKTQPTAMLWQLFPPYQGEQPASKVDFSRLYADLGIYRKTVPAGVKKTELEPAAEILAASGIREWADQLGVVDGKGSNSWVVAGSHTASGKPLLANDPHLGLTAPAVWYFAHMQSPAGKASDGSSIAALDVIGGTFPGLPFVVLGRTAKAAWTFTNTAPDVQDLYLEQINPDNPREYRIPAKASDKAWAAFKIRDETIRVKGQADVKLTVRESRHGPVISDVQKSHAELLDTSRHVLALQWAALDADNQTVLAGLRANQANSAQEMVQAFAAYHSPMQNMLAADTSGGMAYKAVGKVPLRGPDNDIRGMAPSPGWEPRYDWNGWINYAQVPQADQAAIEAKGWWVTANQRITPPAYPFFMGQDWTPPFRFDRIEQLLAATPKHDAASTQRIQGDQLSASALRLLPHLQTTIAQAKGHQLNEPVRAVMQGFDGVMRAGQPAPLVFAAWVDELTRGVMSEAIGPELFTTLYGKRHFRSTVEEFMARNDITWCGRRGCDAQSAAALDRALTRLQNDYGPDVSQWSWGRAHYALSVHKPLGNVPALARFFDVTVPTGGDAFTVNVAQYWAAEGKSPFANRQAASMRAIYDMADLENSRFIYQTGQSGLVFSSRYRDMRDGWAAVEYRPLQMNPSVMRHQLQLRP
ncbi:MAG: penicillin acylase family protein [Pseudomonadota bacterium]